MTFQVLLKTPSILNEDLNTFSILYAENTRNLLHLQETSKLLKFESIFNNIQKTILISNKVSYIFNFLLFF